MTVSLFECLTERSTLCCVFYYYIIRMSDKTFTVFKRLGSKEPNDLIFDQSGYLKREVRFEKLKLLVLHFEDRSLHFLAQGMHCIEYHEGAEFTEFLRENGVPTAVYHIAEIVDKNGLFKLKNGQELLISVAWINTGYDYLIKDPAGVQTTLQFQVGKAGKFKVDLDKPIETIVFVHNGNEADPKIKEAFEKLRKSKNNNRLNGCLKALVILIVFIMLGQLWGWIFG